MPASPQRPLMVFADDWGRHPSSCQHLIRQLLPHREVHWINTIGTRPPRLDLSTLHRVAGKLRQWTGKRPPPESEAKAVLSPVIHAPKMWPSFRSRLARKLNQKLLLRALKPLFESLPQPPNVITTLPLVAELVPHLTAHRWIYYCVDDFSVWPGYDGDTMLRMERDLVPQMAEIVAVSNPLVDHIATFGKKAQLLTHGVDLDHWRNPPTTKPRELAGLETPIVLFWGVIDRRMDVGYVQQLSRQMTRGTIVLLGPQEDPDPELLRLPRVVTRPPASFASLPGLANAASVLVMPYADLPVTRAMQPLKMKEYLATEKPVVVSRLPSTEAWSDGLDVMATAADFASRVCERIASGVPAEQITARRRLEAEGWLAKARLFETWIDG